MNPSVFETQIEAIYGELIARIRSASTVPHNSVRGASLESELADALRKIVPPRYKISTNQLLIDWRGRRSRECDIVIHGGDQTFNYFPRFIPIDMVYAVIEVKSTLNFSEVKDCYKKIWAFNDLDFRGRHTNWCESRLRESKFHFEPPLFAVFGVKSSATNFEQFHAWFLDPNLIRTGYMLENNYSGHESHRTVLCGCLDQGVNRMTWEISHHTHPAVYFGEDFTGKPQKKVNGKTEHISEAKSFFLFLYELELHIQRRKIVECFDVRSYLQDASDLNFIGQHDLRDAAKRCESLLPKLRKAMDEM